MSKPNFTCCGRDPIWVDHVPGKEYWYCKECKNEVLAPKEVIYTTDRATQGLDLDAIANTFTDLPDDVNDWDDDIWDLVNKLYKP